jgi:isopentenyl-diphosphate delta-isomerase
MTTPAPTSSEPIQVVLVDADDREVGLAEKWEAHRTGVLHRAFSVFVFDDAGRVLLQRRARGKYHSGGLWTNTCCGHPLPGESVTDGARRRLREEMGIDVALSPAARFTYRAELEGGMVEHEIDHVLTGAWSGSPLPDPAEVEAWRWIAPAELEREMGDDPARFTAWLPLAWRGIASADGSAAREGG